MNRLPDPNWYDLLQNPEAIKSLYTSVPDLSHVDLLSLLVSREGPRVTVVLDLKEYPDRPPRRWHSEANRVTLALSFGGVKEFVANGFYSDMKVSLRLFQDSNSLLNVVIRNTATNETTSFSAIFCRVDRIGPYATM